MPRSTRFVVVAGPPCAGKSSVALCLAMKLAAPHLEVDRFRRRVVPLSDQRVEHRDIAYRAMHFAAELLVQWAGTVITDATYTAEICRRELVQVVERSKGTLSVIECHVSASIAVERFVRRRSHPAVDLTTNRVARLAGQYPYFNEACAVGGSLHADEITRIVHHVQECPLDRSAWALWCEHGLARERSMPTYNAWPIAERP